MTELKYEEVHPQSRQQLVDAFNSNDSELIASALYSAAWHEKDWHWTQAHCLTFLEHSHANVRWAAALSLGYIAVFHKNLDLERVLPALYKARNDPAIHSIVADSLEMIEQYITKQ